LVEPLIELGIERPLRMILEQVRRSAKILSVDPALPKSVLGQQFQHLEVMDRQEVVLVRILVVVPVVAVMVMVNNRL